MARPAQRNQIGKSVSRALVPLLMEWFVVVDVEPLSVPC